jgi:hypothetical protein
MLIGDFTGREVPASKSTLTNIKVRGSGSHTWSAGLSPSVLNLCSVIGLSTLGPSPRITFGHCNSISSWVGLMSDFTLLVLYVSPFT